MAAADKRLALDTNVLFDRANDESFAKDFFDIFQGHGFSLEVPPTVIAELHHFTLNGTDEEQTASARALSSMLGWRLSPIVLRDVEKTYKKNFITIAEEAGILPGEYNDLHILAETAIKGIPGLVTSDRALREVDSKTLSMAFQNAGLSQVTPVHPAQMLKSLR